MDKALELSNGLVEISESHTEEELVEEFQNRQLLGIFQKAYGHSSGLRVGVYKPDGEERYYAASLTPYIVISSEESPLEMYSNEFIRFYEEIVPQIESDASPDVQDSINFARQVYNSL
jgi:hypothetical protein